MYKYNLSNQIFPNLSKHSDKIRDYLVFHFEAMEVFAASQNIEIKL